MTSLRDLYSLAVLHVGLLQPGLWPLVCEVPTEAHPTAARRVGWAEIRDHYLRTGWPPSPVDVAERVLELVPGSRPSIVLAWMQGEPVNANLAHVAGVRLREAAAEEVAA